MKSIEVKDNTYIDFIKEFNDKDSKFFYKNVFAKGYTPNWSEEAFVIKEVKNTFPWTYFISDLNGT